MFTYDYILLLYCIICSVVGRVTSATIVISVFSGAGRCDLLRVEGWRVGGPELLRFATCFPANVENSSEVFLNWMVL